MYQCKLCLNQVEELKNSHIIPRSTHMQVKDEKGRNIKFVLPSSEFNPKNQSDLKEHMLCGQCEQKLSIFENKAITSLKKPWENYSPKENYKFQPAEIPHIILFLHSILWRASVSQTLGNFTLPPEQEQLIRGSLNKSTPIPLPALAIKISMLQNLKKKDFNNNLILSPWREPYFFGSSASYFSIYGLFITMFDPTCISSSEQADLYLDAQKNSGQIYQAGEYELEILENILASMKRQSR